MLVTFGLVHVEEIPEKQIHKVNTSLLPVVNFEFFLETTFPFLHAYRKIIANDI
jgi:hypothetical protein